MLSLPDLLIYLSPLLVHSHFGLLYLCILYYLLKIPVDHLLLLLLFHTLQWSLNNHYLVVRFHLFATQYRRVLVLVTLSQRVPSLFFAHLTCFQLNFIKGLPKPFGWISRNFCGLVCPHWQLNINFTKNWCRPQWVLLNSLLRHTKAIRRSIMILRYR